MTLFFWCISFLCTLYDDVQIQNLGAKVGAFMAVVRQMWYIVTCRRKHLGRRFFTLIETSWLQELDLMGLTYSKASFFCGCRCVISIHPETKIHPQSWYGTLENDAQTNAAILVSLSFHETINSHRLKHGKNWSKGWMECFSTSSFFVQFKGWTGLGGLSIIASQLVKWRE